MLTTCTDLETGKTLVLRNPDGKCRTNFGSALWVQEQVDSAFSRGDGYAVMTVCSSRNPRLTYKLIKNSCPKYQVSTNYWRTVAAPSAPIIKVAIASGYNTAVFTPIASKQAIAAPIVHYLITNIKTGQVDKASLNNYGELLVSNLSPLTSYTFTVSAVNVDGTSPASTITPVIITGAVPVATVAPATSTLAAPAFTLTSSSENRTVNTAATGFTISSTGGAIASFAISPAAPSGMSLNTATGAFSGTPTATQSATTYTITATNSTGSATQTFTLTVTAVVYAVGDTGPGGGIVYYVSAEYFTSTGSTCNTTCKYLEVAPAGWNNGGVVTNDPDLVWSTIINLTTGQDTVTAGTESGFVNEKFNWKIGQGFYNTSVMKVAGATSTAQAAVLAYAGTSVAGQWFIPSMNELNELCKYARGQTTGVLTVACDNTGTLKTGTASDLGGFMDSGYWSSSEDGASIAWTQDFDGGYQGSANKNDTSYVRPVRAF
jgi:hypothetical protein